MVLPTSFSVNQTCLPSGVAAMFGQKRAVLLDVTDDLMIGDGDDHGLRIEGGADVAVLCRRVRKSACPVRPAP